MDKITCPKCKYNSGDDWTQCGGSCPMVGSPHYKAHYHAVIHFDYKTFSQQLKGDFGRAQFNTLKKYADKAEILVVLHDSAFLGSWNEKRAVLSFLTKEKFLEFRDILDAYEEKHQTTFGRSYKYNIEVK